VIKEFATMTMYTDMMPVRPMARLFGPLAIGIGVSVALGVYGHVHHPTGVAINITGFSSTQTVKVWLATAATSFAVIQLLSALVMYGQIPGVRGPDWLGDLHRWSGRAAFLLAVPVAVHCLYALGFATFDTRTLAHSIAGCFFFGAFTVKMLILPREGVPGWSLPVFGGLVFCALAAVWLTSAFWFFTTIGVKL
jgi:Family of unknown function (DUF6529)